MSREAVRVDSLHLFAPVNSQASVSGQRHVRTIKPQAAIGRGRQPVASPEVCRSTAVYRHVQHERSKAKATAAVQAQYGRMGERQQAGVQEQASHRALDHRADRLAARLCSEVEDRWRGQTSGGVGLGLLSLASASTIVCSSSRLALRAQSRHSPAPKQQGRASVSMHSTRHVNHVHNIGSLPPQAALHRQGAGATRQRRVRRCPCTPGSGSAPSPSRSRPAGRSGRGLESTLSEPAGPGHRPSTQQAPAGRVSATSSTSPVCTQPVQVHASCTARPAVYALFSKEREGAAQGAQGQGHAAGANCTLKNARLRQGTCIPS